MATEQSILAVISAVRPTFRNQHDRVAFALHAAFLSADFILHATGSAAFCDDALTSSPADEVGMDNWLDKWNEVDDNYAFVYSNPQKGPEKVLVKCLVMNDKLLVDALEEGTNSKPLHLEINVGDYVTENGGANYRSQFKNLGKLAADLKKHIWSKLRGFSSSGSSTRRRSPERNLRDDSGSRSLPEEPYISPSSSGFILPPITGSGHNDLFPGPGAGMYPTRGDFGGGSNLIGPHDPRFFPGNRQPGLPGGQQGVPPGARFDPFGPPGLPDFDPDRFGRNPRPGRGTHPDLHHFHDGSDFI